MLKKLLLLLGVGIVAFVAWFVWAIITDEPPHFFPLDNVQAEYRVSKKCPNGQGWNEQVQAEGEGYCIEYKGSDVFSNDVQGNTNFFRITVGQSKINLEPFVGKRVKNIKGKYVSSNKQCVNGKCIDIGGPYVVLNIDELDLAE